MTFVLTETEIRRDFLLLCRLTLFPLPLETEVGELTEGKTGVTVYGIAPGVARTMVWIEMGSV